MDLQLRTVLIATTAATAGLLFGFDTGVISGALLYIQKDFSLSTHALEQLVSILLLGAFIGAIVGGRLCDAIGRKPCLLMTSAIFLIGSIYAAFSVSFAHLLLARLILGLAIGVASFTTPLYLAEISNKRTRGAIVALNQLAVTVGILLAYLSNYYYSAGSNWRAMFFLGIYPALILFIGMCLSPESPRFLAQKGKMLLAKKTAKQLNIEKELVYEVSGASSLWKICQRSKRQRKLLFLVIFLAICPQIAGINTIIYYAPKIMALAGFNERSALMNTVLIGSLNVLATIIALPLVDKIGRRVLLFAGLTVMGVSLLGLALSFSLPTGNAIAGQLALSALLLYIAGFAASLGPVICLLISELLPQAIRAQGMALALSTNWLANMLISSVFLSLIGHIGASAVFILLSLLCLLSLLLIYYFIPETKQQSLEQ